MKKHFTLITLAFLLIAVTTTCNKDVHVAGIKLNEVSLTLEVGDTETLIATVLPENATNQSVIFTSSNPIVATVTSSGLVTALSKGVTIIEITTVDGNFSAKCTVEVDKSFVIEAFDILYSSTDITTVCAMVVGENEEKALTSTQYHNNSFKLKLPSIVDDKYLWPTFKLLVNVGLMVHNHNYESWISDQNAKLTIVRADACDENKNLIGGFFYSGKYINTYAQEFYFYADRNFTIKGQGIDEAENPFECDCSFDEGWNYVYLCWDVEEYDFTNRFLTTTKPSKVWQWYFLKNKNGKNHLTRQKLEIYSGL
jgi:hypothetical protein